MGFEGPGRWFLVVSGGYPQNRPKTPWGPSGNLLKRRRFLRGFFAIFGVFGDFRGKSQKTPKTTKNPKNPKFRPDIEVWAKNLQKVGVTRQNPHLKTRKSKQSVFDIEGIHRFQGGRFLVDFGVFGGFGGNP